MGEKQRRYKTDHVTIKLVGENIRKYRDLIGLSQEKLSLTTKLSRNQISQYELGKVDQNVTSLKLICDVLGIHPGKLFDKEL